MRSPSSDFDFVILGGGIVGLATALALSSRRRLSLAVVEAEKRLASHQTRHNSGVIHSGLYYKPGSLKARLCTDGRELLHRFCAEHGIPCERRGKLLVATTEAQAAQLELLRRRGLANSLRGLRVLDHTELARLEPNVGGLGALLVPETGVVDFARVAEAMASFLRDAGHEVRTSARVTGAHTAGDKVQLLTTSGDIRCRYLINCGGLQCDRVARMCAVDPGLRIIPFRGDYFELVRERRYLVRRLVYPVPDPELPFLGVHLTPTIDGRVLVGPNAVLALSRSGYGRASLSAGDVLDYALYAGFWRMALRHRHVGLTGLARSLSKREFVDSARRLVPAIADGDLVPAGSGVRAQAVDPGGNLVDDFRIVEAARMIHILNAPSPAATASIAIGRYIADLAEKRSDQLRD